jgi:16S rRNA (uracil1498-N3)-methyltransferase
MHRFFVAPDLLSPGADMALPERVAHQVRDVLRLGVGEQLLLLDNSGDELVAAVTKSGRTGVEVRMLERRSGTPASSIRLVLCQGLLKSARFEWILEKGSELGVAAFAPVMCRRSMAGLAEAGAAKVQRWQRILQEASEQCGRSTLPELLPIRSLEQALRAIPPGALALMPWEEERAYSLRAALLSLQARDEPLTVMLFIGPEGGLTVEEVQLAQRHGARVVSLGSRILRAETAALASVANTIFALEG